MIRKQVYLTEEQNRMLARLAQQSGRSQSALIREAIERLAPEQEREARAAVLQAVGGLWSDREDLPDWDALRAESDRRLHTLYDEDRDGAS
jgi:Arc/MetJ-type ribon-helix-helix transcriptional regulator